MANGVRKSNAVPTKTRPSTRKPWMKAPSMTPCATIETIEQDVEEDPRPQDERPHGDEVERVHRDVPSVWSSTWTGALERPLSIGATASVTSAGPFRMRRAIT